jgi:hypothetical protein
MALSTLGLGASLLGIALLLNTWRIGAAGATHDVTIAGLRFSYPTANPDALVVLALGCLGLAVAAMAIVGAARELRNARSFEKRLASTSVASLQDALVIEHPQPLAFCAGLLRPRVYVSKGAVELLDQPALQAVLLHERHHATRRDPLRLAAGRVVAQALFFLPWLTRLHRHEQTLAELGADESAIAAAPENRSALARAILGFIDAPGARAGVDPERVDHLLGKPLSWTFPAALCLAPLLTTGLLVTVALLAGPPAAGSATFALPFVSNQPCLVVIALIPHVAGLAGAPLTRSGVWTRLLTTLHR